MAFQERLLQRICHQEQAPEERRSRLLGQELHSILEHLQRLLNTRQGNVPIRPDYGMPDFSHLSRDTLTQTAEELQIAIRLIIEQFEPRISGVQVAFDAALLDRLHLKVEGVLTRDPRVPLALDATVSAQGRISVAL